MTSQWHDTDPATDYSDDEASENTRLTPNEEYDVESTNPFHSHDDYTIRVPISNVTNVDRDYDNNPKPSLKLQISRRGQLCIIIFLICLAGFFLYGFEVAVSDIAHHSRVVRELPTKSTTSKLATKIPTPSTPSQTTPPSSSTTTPTPPPTKPTTSKPIKSNPSIKSIERSNDTFILVSELYDINEEEETDTISIPYQHPEITYYRREYVREMIRYAWDGYFQQCPGYDELKPISGGCQNWLQNGATAIDAISTLLLLNDTERYQQAISITTLLDPNLTEFDQRQKFQQAFAKPTTMAATTTPPPPPSSIPSAILTQQYTPTPSRSRKVSFFETTIRILGGFLSQYDLTKNPQYLQQAIDVADALMPAFDTNLSGFPSSSIDLSTGIGANADWCSSCYVLADIATIQVEFCGLTAAIYEYEEILIQYQNEQELIMKQNDKQIKKNVRHDSTSIEFDNDNNNNQQETIFETMSSTTSTSTSETMFPMKSKHFPHEYCQRAHHVTTTLYSSSYSHVLSQYTHIFPTFVYPPQKMTLTPTTYRSTINDIQQRLQHGSGSNQAIGDNNHNNINNNKMPNMPNHVQPIPSTRSTRSNTLQPIHHGITIDTTSRLYPYYAALTSKQSTSPQQSTSPSKHSTSLQQSYESDYFFSLFVQDVDMNKNLYTSLVTKEQEMKDKLKLYRGYYSFIRESQGNMYPFDPIQFLLSILAYNQTNTQLPDMYKQLSYDWSELLYLSQDERKKYNGGNGGDGDGGIDFKSHYGKGAVMYNETYLQSFLTSHSPYYGFDMNSTYISNVYGTREQINNGKNDHNKKKIKYGTLTIDENNNNNDDNNTNQVMDILSSTESTLPTYDSILKSLEHHFTTLFDYYFQPDSNSITTYGTAGGKAELTSKLTPSSMLNKLPPTPIPKPFHQLLSHRVDLFHQTNDNHQYTVGPMADSTYEYFLKTWIVTGKTNPIYLDMFKKSIKSLLIFIYREYPVEVPAKLEMMRTARHFNRFFTTESNKKYPTGQYPLKTQGKSNGFYRFDNVNHQSTSTTNNLYPTQTFLQQREDEWIYTTTTSQPPKPHDPTFRQKSSTKLDGTIQLPSISALVNPKLQNRVIKWLTTNKNAILVEVNVSGHGLNNGMSSPQQNTMHHLSCFFPGSLALGLIHNVFNDDEKDDMLSKAEASVRGCVSGYLLNQYTGLAPQTYNFQSNGEFIIRGSDAKYNLRPETVESLYLLYRYTGNQIYREIIWYIIASLEKNCKHKYGYSNLSDVFSKSYEDRQETFLFAEVLKYAYLTFEEGYEEPIDTLGKIKIPKDLNFNQYQPDNNGNNKEKSNNDPFSPFYTNPNNQQSLTPQQQRLIHSNFMDVTNSVELGKTAIPPSPSNLQESKTMQTTASNTSSQQSPVSTRRHQLFDLHKFVFNTEAHPVQVRHLNIDEMLIHSLHP